MISYVPIEQKFCISKQWMKTLKILRFSPFLRVHFFLERKIRWEPTWAPDSPQPSPTGEIWLLPNPKDQETKRTLPKWRNFWINSLVTKVCFFLMLLFLFCLPLCVCVRERKKERGKGRGGVKRITEKKKNEWKKRWIWYVLESLRLMQVKLDTTLFNFYVFVYLICVFYTTGIT